MQRHYGLDWLRIGAFAILIVYHVGMVFVPWGYHARLPGPEWMTVPMMASNPWRLSLLFVVSGYASRALLARSAGPGRFAANRSKRLLIPLIFGMAVIVPPQPWVELVTQHGYTASFWTFLAHDYFGFRRIAGLDLPTWNHLWFVAYLWLYTLILTALIAILPATARAAAQRFYTAFFARWAALLLPMAWLVMVSAFLFPGGRETHALVGDWVAHATYLPMFLFGFGLAGAPAILAAFARQWKVAAIVAVAAFAIVAGIELGWPGLRSPPRILGRIFSIMRGVEGWAAIAALIGIAETYWNRDHRWRPMLTEAVFPFYIIHQTIIVVVAWWLMPRGLPWWADFAILVAATIAGCWVFYLAGRSIAPLRPLIGLRRHRPARAAVDPRPAIG